MDHKLPAMIIARLLYEGYDFLKGISFFELSILDAIIDVTLKRIQLNKIALMAIWRLSSFTQSVQFPDALMTSAPFSANPYVVAIKCSDIVIGTIEESTTRRF